MFRNFKTTIFHSPFVRGCKLKKWTKIKVFDSIETQIHAPNPRLTSNAHRFRLETESKTMRELFHTKNSARIAHLFIIFLLKETSNAHCLHCVMIGTTTKMVRIMWNRDFAIFFEYSVCIYPEHDDSDLQTEHIMQTFWENLFSTENDNCVSERVCVRLLFYGTGNKV